ncbi:hypothetical protein MRB53_014233 [Persea americana]|uniref:Uncharacterized protein n=1 Tax=Persea americana TaxID=3435 RepID=A0ACC2KAS2_PERAE|nr:hypothetical protein MRB53_014233 [Persea americana]
MMDSSSNDVEDWQDLPSLATRAKKLVRDERRGQADLQIETRLPPPFTGSGFATRLAVIFFSGKTRTLITLRCSLSSLIRMWCPAREPSSLLLPRAHTRWRTAAL